MMRQLQWTPSPSVLQSSASAAETDPSQLGPPLATRHAPRESKLSFALHPNPEIGTSCTGGTERRRLGRVRLLDENRDPHNELSRVSGEMRGVVDSRVAAGRGHFRRSDRRAKAVREHREPGRKGILQKQGGRSFISRKTTAAPAYVAV
jgi:hypothetical protein